MAVKTRPYHGAVRAIRDWAGITGRSIPGHAGKNVLNESCAELRQKSREGATAMAERKLGLKIYLGHGLAKAWQKKQRIVTEAAGTARCIENHALDGTVGYLNHLAIARDHQRALIARRAQRRRKFFHPLQKDHVIPDVGVVVGVG